MKNPIKDKKDSYRVIRGAGWGSFPLYVRTSHRSSFSPARQSSSLGFRLVKNIPKDKK